MAIQKQKDEITVEREVREGQEGDLKLPGNFIYILYILHILHDF